MSPSRAALNGCVFFHSGWSGRQCLHAVKPESQLGVHRMFHPQSAIIIERCDALSGRHKIWRTLSRHCGNEIQDCLFRTPLFHEGSTTAAFPVCACAEMDRSGPDIGSTARAESSERRFVPDEGGFGDMANSSSILSRGGRLDASLRRQV